MQVGKKLLKLIPKLILVDIFNFSVSLTPSTIALKEMIKGKICGLQLSDFDCNFLLIPEFGENI